MVFACLFGVPVPLFVSLQVYLLACALVFVQGLCLDVCVLCDQHLHLGVLSQLQRFDCAGSCRVPFAMKVLHLSFAHIRAHMAGLN